MTPSAWGDNMTESKPNHETKPSVWRSLRNGFFFALAILTIAYAFQVTKVDLSEFRKESRQQSRTRVMRALANPDLFEFDRAETIVNSPLYLPCPEEVEPQIQREESGAAYVESLSCGKAGDIITLEGYNFPPNTDVLISYIPENDPQSALALAKARVKSDTQGHFTAEVELPKDRDSADTQFLRSYSYRNVGAPRWSKSALDTWDKIIETVFMAFLATLLGTALSFPLSFLAARNLMKNVKSPLTSIALNLLGWPLGIFLGFQAGAYLLESSGSFAGNAWFNASGMILAGALTYLLTRWSLSRGDDALSGMSQRALQELVSLTASVLTVYVVLETGSLFMNLGAAMIEPLGGFGFIGNFLFQSGDILRAITPTLAALVGGGILSSRLGRFGQTLSERLSQSAAHGVNAVVSAAAGAMLFMGIGQTLNWFYEIGNPLYILTLPAILGAAGGLALAFLTKPKASLPIGLIVYYVTRAIVNAVRSVEAVIMAIVFVIFVGIGPFAGVMALGLHTIASLVKLYSEQVESILAGPIEAIEATGANRLQTIIYAVIPQIIPPYISYTMYRWDINVRMSTIIGITGGGGIGFLLVQNINLLDYNAAATQMLAIAIVVSLMDYVSSALRERVV